MTKATSIVEGCFPVSGVQAPGTLFVAPSECAGLSLTALVTASNSSEQATHLFPQSEARRPEFVLVNLTIETRDLGSWRRPTGIGSTRGGVLTYLFVPKREGFPRPSHVVRVSTTAVLSRAVLFPVIHSLVLCAQMIENRSCPHPGLWVSGDNSPAEHLPNESAGCLGIG